MKMKQIAAVLMIVSMMVPHMSVQAGQDMPAGIQVNRTGEQPVASSGTPAGAYVSQHNIMNVYCRPSGTVVTADGKVLVTDRYNKVVWYCQNGVSTVFAGGGGYLAQPA